MEKNLHDHKELIAWQKAIELVEIIAFNEFTERIVILPKNFN
jgi:hypothetical protein